MLVCQEDQTKNIIRLLPHIQNQNLPKDQSTISKVLVALGATYLMNNKPTQRSSAQYALALNVFSPSQLATNLHRIGAIGNSVYEGAMAVLMAPLGCMTYKDEDVSEPLPTDDYEYENEADDKPNDNYNEYNYTSEDPNYNGSGSSSSSSKIECSTDKDNDGHISNIW